MKAKISKKGLAILKNTQASKALVAAIVNNSSQLSNGDAVPFTISVHDGDIKKDKIITVRKVTAL